MDGHRQVHYFVYHKMREDSLPVTCPRFLSSSVSYWQAQRAEVVPEVWFVLRGTQVPYRGRAWQGSWFLSDCFQPMFRWWVRYSCFPGIFLWTRFGLKTCLLSKISNQKQKSPEFFSETHLGCELKIFKQKQRSWLACLPAKSRPKLQRFWRAKRFLCMQGFGAWQGVYGWRCQNLGDVGGSWVRRVGGLEGWRVGGLEGWRGWSDSSKTAKWSKFSCLVDIYILFGTTGQLMNADLSTLAICQQSAIKRCKVAPFAPKNLSWTVKHQRCVQLVRFPNAGVRLCWSGKWPTKECQSSRVAEEVQHLVFHHIPSIASITKWTNTWRMRHEVTRWFKPSTT